MFEYVMAPRNSVHDFDCIDDILKGLTGVDFTLLEGSSHFDDDENYVVEVTVCAKDSGGEFEEYKGYYIEILETECYHLNASRELCIYSIQLAVPAPAYDKVICTHEEIKERMDQLWRFCEPGAERFALMRLYEFMSEPHPID